MIGFEITKSASGRCFLYRTVPGALSLKSYLMWRTVR